MLTGAAIMDMALLLVAANVDCPQPQTAEHVSALEIMQLKNIIIVQNKIDLIFGDKDKLKQNYKQIKEFMKDSVCKNAPIIPVCAQMKYNIDAILQAICEVPLPEQNSSEPPLMTIIRSFDVNRPGESFENIKGGVVGGTIQKGVLKVGMEIEIKPGILTKDERGTVKYRPIKSRITSLIA
jgi:translation initiation factor 2 subunit 3